MVKTSRAQDREEAVGFGQLLVVGNFIAPFNDSQSFADKRIYFRFTEQDQHGSVGPSITSLIEDARVSESPLQYGWLSISKGVMQHDRFCILATSPQRVFYHFATDVAAQPSGFINLEKTRFSLIYSGLLTFQLDVATIDASRSIKLTAKCPDEFALEAWVQAFVDIGATVVDSPSSTAAALKQFKPEASIFDFFAYDINHKHNISLSVFRGKVILVANVGFNDKTAAMNFFQLQSLHDKYSPQGLCIIAFPCLQFSETVSHLVDVPYR